MRKSKIIALVLIGIGIVFFIGSLLSVNFDFSKFSFTGNFKLVEKTEATSEKITLDINLLTTDLEIKPSEDDDIHVKYFTSEHKVIEYSFTNNVLKMEEKYLREHWYDYLQFSFDFTSRDVIVCVPEELLSKIDVNITTGSVNIVNFSSLTDIAINKTTGDLEINHASCDSLAVASTTGSVNLSSVTVRKDLFLQCNTGSIDLDGVNITNKGVLKSSTGEIEVEDSSVKELKATTTTGSIHFDDLLADKMILATTTGSIKGEFPDAKTNYTITSKTNTGSNNLPEEYIVGDKILDVSTETGSINIKFND